MSGYINVCGLIIWNIFLQSASISNWNAVIREGQLARWLERLEEFQFEIIHRKGKVHSNADALSRIPSDQHDIVRDEFPVSLILPAVVVGERSPEDIKNCQVNDELIGPIYQAKIEGVKPSEQSIKGQDPKFRRLVQLWDQLVVKDELLWRLFENNDGTEYIYQLVIPSALKSEVLRDIHEGILGGHLGIDKCLGRLKERFYWPGQYNDVKQWCSTCVTCATRKPGGAKRRGPLQPVVVGYPLQLVAVDILGPLPVTSQGNSYILVAEDYFTRWLEAWPIPNQETKTVAQKLLNEMFFHFSLPDQILSDQGRQFESGVMEELCKLLQIEKSRTTPYHPQGDGLVERANRTFLNMLSTVVEEHQEEWESHLRPICMAYNTSIQPTTGYSPFFLMFGRTARMPIDLVYGTNNSNSQNVHCFVRDMANVLENAYRHVRSTMGLKQEHQKELYDRKRHGDPYKVGDLVWLHSPVVPRGSSRKLHHPWTGPYKIVKQLSDVTYRIQSCRGRRCRLVVHFNRLKPSPDDMRFKEIVNSQPLVPSCPCHQRTEVPRNSPLIVLDDCDDISPVADDSVPVGDRGTLEENVPNDQSTNTDVATQEVSAADAIDSSSQPMVTSNIDNAPAHVNSHRYPRHTHHLPQRYNDYQRH